MLRNVGCPRFPRCSQPCMNRPMSARAKMHTSPHYGGRIIALIPLNPWEDLYPVIGSFILLHRGRLSTSRNLLRSVCVRASSATSETGCVFDFQNCAPSCAAASDDLKVFAILCSPGHLRVCVCVPNPVCVLFSSSVSV